MFENAGNVKLGTAVLNGGNGAGFATMDAAGIASGQAFLTSELEKRDTLIRTPLTSFTYGRDTVIRVAKIECE